MEIMEITEKNSMEELKRKEMLTVNTIELEKMNINFAKTF